MNDKSSILPLSDRACKALLAAPDILRRSNLDVQVEVENYRQRKLWEAAGYDPLPMEALPVEAPFIFAQDFDPPEREAHASRFLIMAIFLGACAVFGLIGWLGA